MSVGSHSDGTPVSGKGSRLVLAAFQSPVLCTVVPTWGAAWETLAALLTFGTRQLRR